jgi:hypothetical protein
MAFEQQHGGMSCTQRDTRAVSRAPLSKLTQFRFKRPAEIE